MSDKVEGNTGIKIETIRLENIEFKRKSNVTKKNKLEIDFIPTKIIKDDNNKLIFKINYKITEKSNNNISINATTVGIFSNFKNIEMKINKFAKYNAPAIMFPYIRETISSITTKAGLNSITLPPTNIINLVGDNDNENENKSD